VSARPLILPSTVGIGKAGIRQLPPAVDSAKQRRILFASNPGRGDVGVQVLLGLALNGYLVRLSAFLPQRDLPAFALLVLIVHVHADNGSDTGEAEHHDGDQGPVAEASDGTYVDSLE